MSDGLLRHVRLRHAALAIALLPITVFLAAGCGSSNATRYVHPEADLATIKKVAVLPFENVTQDRSAADKVQKIFLIELLSLEVFDVVEPGQVTKVIRAEKAESPDALGPADLKRIGEQLGVDGMFIGTVVDFQETRSGNTPAPEVTIQLRLVETATGKTMWSTSQNRSGISTSARLFGIGGQSLTEVSRELVRKGLNTLFQ